MSIVGIDQSLSGTGIVEIGTDGSLKRSQLLGPGKLLGVRRLDFITEKIIDFLSEIKERFVVSREGYSFASKGRSIFNLGELGGCIDLVLFRSKIPNLVEYYILPPTVVKKFCLGSGSVKKDSSYLLAVFKKLEIEFKNDNQADAYMIATTLLGFKKAICLQQGFDHENFVNLLDVAKKEALLSTLLSAKGSGVTKSVVKTMSHVDFANNVSNVIEQYKVFSRV